MTVTGTAPDRASAPQRKRGAALRDAILAAAYDELTESGWTAFSVEAVAARARTGKASIYRRWPTKAELVLDCLSVELPSVEACGVEHLIELDDSTTTEQALRRVGVTIARTLASPIGQAVRAIKLEAHSDPHLAALVDARFQAPRRQALIGLLQRGIARGEVRPGADSVIIADVLPAVLVHRVLMLREQVTESDVLDVIEQVMIPLVEVR